jgi:hypothetical protein
MKNPFENFFGTPLTERQRSKKEELVALQEEYDKLCKKKAALKKRENSFFRSGTESIERLSDEEEARREALGRFWVRGNWELIDLATREKIPPHLSREEHARMRALEEYTDDSRLVDLAQKQMLGALWGEEEKEFRRLREAYPDKSAKKWQETQKLMGWKDEGPRFING